jgi:hypothetical protein
MIVVAGLISFNACKKETNDQVVNKTTTEIKESKKDGENQFGIYFKYTNPEGKAVTAYIEWRGGRGRSCNGRGICDVHAGIRDGSVTPPADITQGYRNSPIYVRPDGTLYACILREETSQPLPGNGESFYIDEDFYTDDGYRHYLIPNGVYTLNETLGANGGFTIPVILQ